MGDFLSISNIAFTFLGYEMSWVELIGTIFNLLSVWLVARNSIWNWPVGIIGVIAFFSLFYQIRLYSDTIEQGYFFVASIVGWVLWAKRGSVAAGLRRVRSLNLEQSLQSAVAVLGLTFVLTYVISNIHIWLPTLFPQPTTYPFFDSLTTVLSFAAIIYQARRIVDSWYYWIVVDVIGVVLYWMKDVKLVSILYFIFLLICIHGLVNWRKLQNIPRKARVYESPLFTVEGL